MGLGHWPKDPAAGTAIQPKNLLPIVLHKKYKIEPRDNVLQIDLPVAPPAKGP